MSALAIDPVYNDFQFVGGVMQVVASNSIAECAQELTARFNFAKGEWSLDTQQGFPYLQSVFVKAPDPAVLGTLYQSVINSTPGVAGISSWTIALNRQTRLLAWNAQIKHQSGSYITGGYGQPFIVATPPVPVGAGL